MHVFNTRYAVNNNPRRAPTTAKIIQNMRLDGKQKYKLIRTETTSDNQDNLMVISGIIIKGRHIITPEQLWKQALEQLYSNQLGTEKNQGY